MAFSVPSLGGMAQNVGKTTTAPATQPAAPTAPAATTAPAAQAAQPQPAVDSFDSGAAKTAVCGGTDTAGAACLPTWGKDSGGGGGGVGVNPSRGGR